MVTSRKIALSTLLLITASVTTVIFQNCSKVNYKELDGSNSSSGAISRTVTINPTFSDNKAPLKVLLVVDDSYTMSQSQAKLSSALDSLLDPLVGRNVSYKIVSTSGVPNNQIDYKITKKYFNEQNLEISVAQTSQTSSYFIENHVTNNVGVRHPEFSTLKDFNAAQFESVKSQIKQAVLNVGTSGSDTEEGICAVLRQIYDNSSQRFFNEGDNVAIITITDENDSSEFKTCVSRYREKVSNKPIVYYSYMQQRANLKLEYRTVQDGIEKWLPVTWGVGLPHQNHFNQGAVCHESDKAVAVQKIKDIGYTIRNVSSCVYEATETTHYGSDLGDDGSDKNLNLCKDTVVFQGISYSNLYEYIKAAGLSAVSGSCKKLTQPANSIVRTQDYTSVIESDTSFSTSNINDLGTALVSKSFELFGSNFIYAPIIRTSNETCTLQQGQSRGLKYEDIAIKLPDNSEVESLCASNFSNVLNKVSTFIVNSADNSYLVSDLKDNEKIASVTVVRGQQRILLTNDNHEVVGATITLTDFTLKSGDILEVYITNK